MDDSSVSPRTKETKGMERVEREACVESMVEKNRWNGMTQRTGNFDPIFSLDFLIWGREV